MYLDKYIKYKNKYNDLKQKIYSTQIGGEIIEVTNNKRTFAVHSNGSRPYKYTINYKTGEIKVFEIKEEYAEKDEYDENPTLYLKNYSEYERFYIGHDYGRDSWHCGGKEYNYGEGNSLLIHIQNDDYIFIGHTMIHLSIPDQVIYFYSPIGNNDVPYPVIIGIQLYIELGTKTILRKSELKIGRIINQMMLTTYGRGYEMKKYDEKQEKIEKNVINDIVIKEYDLNDAKSVDVIKNIKKSKKQKNYSSAFYPLSFNSTYLTYYTMTSGDSKYNYPYCVRVSLVDKKIFVYPKSDKSGRFDYKFNYIAQPILEKSFTNIFFGSDYHLDVDSCDDDKSDKSVLGMQSIPIDTFEGVSFLIQDKLNHYYYIGSRVYGFTTKEKNITANPIDNFYAMVNTNDKKKDTRWTSQSFAIGEQYVYLLDIQKLIEKRNLHKENPYKQIKDIDMLKDIMIDKKKSQ